VIAAISCVLHPASAKRRAAALRSPWALHPLKPTANKLGRWVFNRTKASELGHSPLGMIEARAFAHAGYKLRNGVLLVGAPSTNRDHHFSFVAENRRTKSGFSFANGDSVTHMRQGFPVQRAFAAPSRSICPAALTASSRAVPRSGSSTPMWSMWVRSSSIWK
jgi:hypothetical protein